MKEIGEIKMGLQMCWYEYTRIQTCSWKIKLLTLSHEEDATRLFEYIADDKHSTLDAPGGGGRGGTLRYGLD